LKLAQGEYFAILDHDAFYLMIPGNGIETHLKVKTSLQLRGPSFYLMIPGNGIETKIAYHPNRNRLLSGLSI